MWSIEVGNSGGARDRRDPMPATVFLRCPITGAVIARLILHWLIVVSKHVAAAMRIILTVNQYPDVLEALYTNALHSLRSSRYIVHVIINYFKYLCHSPR